MISNIMKTLAQIAAERPYPDYQEWWPMGQSFITMMQNAILTVWLETMDGQNDYRKPEEYARKYIQTVYGREMRPNLVYDFSNSIVENACYSGEFDALSYAFYRSSFEKLRQYASPNSLRDFTKTVGKNFFNALSSNLGLSLPETLASEQDFNLLRNTIRKIGAFLVKEGYLRDKFVFSFNVALNYKGTKLRQTEKQFFTNLTTSQISYAVYRMGYPAILPSAVYLYLTIGEAQHHSSRTIEELFSRVNCEARETADFDPSGFPAEEVVELWEIQKL